MQTVLKDLLDETEGFALQCVQEALSTIGIQSTNSASKEVHDAVMALVKQIGTKKEVITQVMNFEDGEYEKRIAME